MATLEELSRQIGAAGDLQSVVGTMKALSAAGIRTHEAAEAAMARYLATIESGLQVVLAALGDEVPAPPSDPRAAETLTGAVIVGSEIGLCGSFNERLVEFACEGLSALGAPAERRLVLVIGSRAASAWTAAAEPPDEVAEAPATIEAMARTVATVITRLDDWRAARGVGRLVVFHHGPDENTTGRPERIDLWPVDPAWLDALRRRPWPGRGLPLCGGTPRSLLPALIRQLLFARVFTAVIRSRTAEHAERLAAMQAADRSIADKLETLQIAWRQRRQDVITAEILDLVAGYEASGGEGPAKGA